MYMNYYINILFIPLLMLSSIMIFSMNSWFSMWMVMELNLLSFFPMMFFDYNIKKYDCMIYLLIQALSSYMFLLSSMFIVFNNNNFEMLFILLINLSLLTKLGITPIYFWYPKVMLNMNWLNVYMLSITQKIIPLFCMNMLLKYYMNLIKLNLLNLIFCMIMSLIYSINQINMRMILCFSSMMHISMILILLIFNEMFSIIYFFIYMIINLLLIMLLFKFNIINMFDLMLMKFINKNYMMMIMILMMSLSGLPPMFGFLLKWMFIQNLYFINFYFLILLIFFSLIFMYVYLRLIFVFFMNNYLINKMSYKILILNYMNFNKLNMFIILNLFLLLMFELI